MRDGGRVRHRPRRCGRVSDGELGADAPASQRGGDVACRRFDRPEESFRAGEIEINRIVHVRGMHRMRSADGFGCARRSRGIRSMRCMRSAGCADANLLTRMGANALEAELFALRVSAMADIGLIAWRIVRGAGGRVCVDRSRHRPERDDGCVAEEPPRDGQQRATIVFGMMFERAERRTDRAGLREKCADANAGRAGEGVGRNDTLTVGGRMDENQRRMDENQWRIIGVIRRVC